MGGFKGKYSRSPFSTFNEEKNYAFALMQEGIPVTDDDENSNRLQLLHHFRRGTQLFGDYGTPNDGFRVQESGTSNINNFKLTGGGPANTDIENAGRFFMRGHQCVLMHDVDYYNTLSDVAEQSIHPRTTRVYYDGTDTVVEDSAANWVTDELLGRDVRIDGVDYAITSNGQDSFKISGDHTAAILSLAYYILLLSTPPGPGARTDGVYLNVYIDEYDDSDDPEIAKKIGGVDVVAQLRAKVIQTLFVREDVATHGELIDYVDSDGNQHYVSKLAELYRLGSDATITSAMIVDLVETIGFEGIGRSHLLDLRVTATYPASNQVDVSSGLCRTVGGNSTVSFAGGLSPVFTAAPAGEARYDRLVISDAGVLSRQAGVAGVTPVIPDIQNHAYTTLAIIRVDDTGIVNSDDIIDVRPFIGESPGAVRVYDASKTFEDNVTLAMASGCPRLFIPAGSYDVVGTVTTDDIEIIGAGVDKTTINLNATGAHFVISSNTAIRNVEINCAYNPTYGDIYIPSGPAVAGQRIIENCKFNSGGAAGTKACIYITGDSTGITISRCEFTSGAMPDSGSMILVDDFGLSLPSSIIIRDCYFYQTGLASQQGQVTVDRSKNVSIENCTFHGIGYMTVPSIRLKCSGAAIDTFNTQIRDCHFEVRQSESGIEVEHPALVSGVTVTNCDVDLATPTTYSSFITGLGDNFTITGNRVKGVNAASPGTVFIRLPSALMAGAFTNNTQITGNAVFQVETFLLIENTTLIFSTISGNTYYNTSSTVVLAMDFILGSGTTHSLTYGTVSTNVVDIRSSGSSTGAFIDVYQTSGLLIQGNWAGTTNYTLISVDKSIKCKIDDNYLYNEGSSIIDMHESTDDTVSGNTVEMFGAVAVPAILIDTRVWNCQIRENTVKAEYGYMFDLRPPVQVAGGPLELDLVKVTIADNYFDGYSYVGKLNYAFSRVEFTGNHVSIWSDVDGTLADPDASLIQVFQDQTDVVPANIQALEDAPMFVFNDNIFYWNKNNDSYYSVTPPYDTLVGAAAVIHFYNWNSASSSDTIWLKNGITINDNSFTVSVMGDYKTRCLWFNTEYRPVEHLTVSGNKVLMVSPNLNDGIQTIFMEGNTDTVTFNNFERLCVSDNDVTIEVNSDSGSGLATWLLLPKVTEIGSITGNVVRLANTNASGNGYGVFALGPASSGQLVGVAIANNSITFALLTGGYAINADSILSTAITGNILNSAPTASIAQPSAHSGKNAIVGNIFTTGQVLTGGVWEALGLSQEVGNVL